MSLLPTPETPELPVSQISFGSSPVGQFWRAHARGELIGLPTSGTSTGAGRVVVRSTASWVDSFDLFARAVGVSGADRIWVPGPLSSTMNLYAACLAEYLGAEWSAVDRSRASVAQLTPATLRRLLESDPSDAPELRTVIVAGDGLTPRLRDQASAAGLLVHHYYGAAELSLVGLGTCTADLAPFERVEIEERAGVIWVRSPWVCSGYLQQCGDSPLQVDQRGFRSVGDRGHLDDGRLVIEGRAGAVTTAGQTVTLAPLLARLREQARGEVQLLGLPHQQIGQVLTAVLSDPADLDPLRRWAHRELQGADRPRRWVVAETRLTPAGKVDLRALRDHLIGAGRDQV